LSYQPTRCRRSGDPRSSYPPLPDSPPWLSAGNLPPHKNERRTSGNVFKTELEISGDKNIQPVFGDRERERERKRGLNEGVQSFEDAETFRHSSGERES
jgi:hypothetical protein